MAKFGLDIVRCQTSCTVHLHLHENHFKYVMCNSWGCTFECLRRSRCKPKCSYLYSRNPKDAHHCRSDQTHNSDLCKSACCLTLCFPCLPGRSPWSNKYDPPLEDGAMPSARLRKLEVEANNAFDQYRDLYVSSTIQSPLLSLFPSAGMQYIYWSEMQCLRGWHTCV